LCLLARCKTKELSERPNMICDSSLHRGGDAERLMYPAEVVPSHVQGDGGFQILKLLAKGVHQPREAPQVHPEIQIGPLHMACADMGFVRVAADWGWDRLDNLAGAVPVRSGLSGLP
jgi:hypothetical protein